MLKLNAINNYWGSDLGPIKFYKDSRNLNRDRISENILFLPFLTLNNH